MTVRTSGWTHRRLGDLIADWPELNRKRPDIFTAERMAQAQTMLNIERELRRRYRRDRDRRLSRFHPRTISPEKMVSSERVQRAMQNLVARGHDPHDLYLLTLWGAGCTYREIAEEIGMELGGAHPTRRIRRQVHRAFEPLIAEILTLRKEEKAQRRIREHEA